jgi:hypothetical protein
MPDERLYYMPGERGKMAEISMGKTEVVVVLSDNEKRQLCQYLLSQAKDDRISNEQRRSLGSFIAEVFVSQQNAEPFKVAVSKGIFESDVAPLLREARIVEQVLFGEGNAPFLAEGNMSRAIQNLRSRFLGGRETR